MTLSSVEEKQTLKYKRRLSSDQSVSQWRLRYDLLIDMSGSHGIMALQQHSE